MTVATGVIGNTTGGINGTNTERAYEKLENSYRKNVLWLAKELAPGWVS